MAKAKLMYACKRIEKFNYNRAMLAFHVKKCKQNLQDYVSHVEDLVDSLNTHLVAHQDQHIKKLTFNRVFQLQGCM